MTGKLATYATAIAYGKFVTYSCGRCLNNRGTMLVIKLGPQLWRTDTKKRTTKAELERDNWHPVPKQSWGR